MSGYAPRPISAMNSQTNMELCPRHLLPHLVQQGQKSGATVTPCQSRMPAQPLYIRLSLMVTRKLQLVQNALAPTGHSVSDGSFTGER